MKTCTRCHQTLSRSEFYKERKSSDGLRNVCKHCHKSLYYSKRERRTSLSLLNDERSFKRMLKKMHLPTNSPRWLVFESLLDFFNSVLYDSEDAEFMAVHMTSILTVENADTSILNDLFQPVLLTNKIDELAATVALLNHEKLIDEVVYGQFLVALKAYEVSER